MNLGTLIGEMLLRAEGATPGPGLKRAEPKPRRELWLTKIQRVLAESEPLTMAELFGAVGATNRQSFCVTLSTLCKRGLVRKTGEAHSYRYSLPGRRG